MPEIQTKPNIKRRILAGFIDYSIIYSLAFALIIGLGEPDSEGVYTLEGPLALAPLLLWLVMTVGFESGLGGTIGNSIVRLKAIPVSGRHRRLTFLESLKRHLLDPIDMFFFGFVGIVAIKNTERNQRVGDLWAKTIVVSRKQLEESNT